MPKKGPSSPEWTNIVFPVFQKKVSEFCDVDQLLNKRIFKITSIKLEVDS